MREGEIAVNLKQLITRTRRYKLAINKFRLEFKRFLNIKGVRFQSNFLVEVVNGMTRVKWHRDYIM